MGKVSLFFALRRSLIGLLKKNILDIGSFRGTFWKMIWGWQYWLNNSPTPLRKISTLFFPVSG